VKGRNVTEIVQSKREDNFLLDNSDGDQFVCPYARERPRHTYQMLFHIKVLVVLFAIVLGVAEYQDSSIRKGVRPRRD
jgi:hypothetical protein